MQKKTVAKKNQLKFIVPERNQRTPIAEATIVLHNISSLFKNVKFKDGKEDFWESVFRYMWNDETSGGDKQLQEMVDEMNELERATPQNNEMMRLVGYLTPAFVSIAYCVDTVRAQKAGEITEAWSYVCTANHWAGVMEGISKAEEASKEPISEFARKGAMAHHAENHAMKKSVFDWYEQTHTMFKSMSKAADAAFDAKLVPVAHRTIYEWIREFKKTQPTGRA